jgi:hypothetical protein
MGSGRKTDEALNRQQTQADRQADRRQTNTANSCLQG